MANRYFPFLLQDLAFLKPHYSFANFRLGKVWEWKMSEAWVTKTKNKHFKISWLEKDCVSLLTDIYVFLTLCTFQFFVTNAFLNYQFISYGFEVYQHYRWGKMSLKQRKITVKIFFIADCLQRRDNYLTQSTLCVKFSPKVSDICQRFKRLSLKHACVSVAVCRYQRYGRGGGQETKGALCILSLNMINDKVTP